MITVALPSRDGGFTLMELLIVLTIGGMLVSLAAPMYSAVMPGARARSQVNELIVTLRDTANKAVSSGHETRIEFAPEASSYTSGNAPTVTLSAGTELIVEASLDPHRRPAEYDGSERGVVTMKFFPDGSSSGGTIRLRSANRDYLVGVDWLTGRVEVLEHAGAAR